MTNTETRVLSPGDAMSLGELLIKVTQKSFVRWMDEEGTIREGEMRSLVAGPNNFAFAPFGTDVRDMYIWVTSGGFETTFSVAHGVSMFTEGGIMFER